MTGQRNFEGLGAILHRRRTMFEALPNESQCSECGYFDVEHPEVQRIFRERHEQDQQNWFELGKCKCKTREAQEVAKANLRWQQANLPNGALGPRTFDNFTPTPQTEVMHQASRRFAAGAGPSILTLLGPKGVGKSHHLEAVCRNALELGRAARYEVAAELLDRLRFSYEDASEQDLRTMLSWYHRFSVLALDEIALQRTTPWGQEQLYKLVDFRLRHGGRLVVASMKSTEEIAEAAGEALASRICGTRDDLGEVQVVTTVAPDYRSA